MDFETYWRRLVERNRDLQDRDVKMTISVDNFRKCLEQAHAQGAEHGRAQQKRRDGVFRQFGM